MMWQEEFVEHCAGTAQGNLSRQEALKEWARLEDSRDCTRPSCQNPGDATIVKSPFAFALTKYSP
eukprot:5317414-Amphidinium_carterae.1